MDKKEITERVSAIEEIAWDDESAHSKEDSLREDFIEYIAKRKDSLGDKAKMILSTNDIDFARWCA